MKLLVGLGNPGREYATTRHNIGWRALDTLLADQASAFATRADFQADIAEWRAGGEKILLAKPLTYMNRSGEAVQRIVGFYKIPHEHILIVHDELDFPLGRLAFLAEGRPGGHNGVASIQERLGTTAIPRLRIGIGRPQDQRPVDVHVLSSFTPEEERTAQEILKRAANAIRDWVAVGTTNAMNQWNKKETIGP